MVALLIRPRPVANCRQPKIKSTRQSNACNLAMVVFCLIMLMFWRAGDYPCALMVRYMFTQQPPPASLFRRVVIEWSLGRVGRRVERVRERVRRGSAAQRIRWRLRFGTCRRWRRSQKAGEHDGKGTRTRTLQPIRKTGSFAKKVGSFFTCLKCRGLSSSWVHEKAYYYARSPMVPNLFFAPASPDQLWNLDCPPRRDIKILNLN